MKRILMATIMAFVFLFLLVAVNAHAAKKYKVLKVVDGDTVWLEVDGKRESTRLIGVDTPETVHPFRPVECYGAEASNYLKQRLPVGTMVKAKFGKNRGKWGRLLAYVYDGRKMINAELVKKGYAHAYGLFGHQYLNKFMNLERQAQRKGRGLWGACYGGETL